MKIKYFYAVAELEVFYEDSIDFYKKIINDRRAIWKDTKEEAIKAYIDKYKHLPSDNIILESVFVDKSEDENREA